MTNDTGDKTFVMGQEFIWDPSDKSPENIALGVSLFGEDLVRTLLNNASKVTGTGSLVVTAIDHDSKTITVSGDKE